MQPPTTNAQPARTTDTSTASISNRRLELLAPAGGFEQLKTAVHFGADAVYLAGSRWGMRKRADNFSDEQLADAVAYAHARGVFVYLALNTLMYDTDLAALPAYLAHIDQLAVDAVIVSDLGALALARRHAPHVAIHVSTQASVANVEAARVYASLGASRIVLAREMTLAQISSLHEQLGDSIELEAFVHGSMCVAVSGRCLLSATLMGTQRSAASGACTQPCRWAWTLADERDPDARVDLETDARGSYLLSSNDLCMLSHMHELIDAGIVSAKIEGRNKGIHYVATTVNAYRHVIDGDDPKLWMAELENTSHRPFSTGFFYGSPTQNPGRIDYIRERTVVAVVQACTPAMHDERANAHTGTAPHVDSKGPYKRFCIEVICRNAASSTDLLTLLAPGKKIANLSLGPTELWDTKSASWQPTDGLRHNQQRYRFWSSTPLQSGDLLCRRQQA